MANNFPQDEPEHENEGGCAWLCLVLFGLLLTTAAVLAWLSIFT